MCRRCGRCFELLPNHKGFADVCPECWRPKTEERQIEARKHDPARQVEWMMFEMKQERLTQRLARRRKLDSWMGAFKRFIGLS